MAAPLRQWDPGRQVGPRAGREGECYSLRQVAILMAASFEGPGRDL